MNVAEKATTSTPVAYALRFAGLGWSVFPCKPRDKRPIHSGGFQNATTDERIIREWFRDNPRANLGVPAGAAFWVLDIDPRHGGADALAAILDRFGDLPETLIQRTPSGGMHYFFRADPRARNTAAKIGPGIDTRGAGGYVCVEGSITEAGRYQFQDWDPLTEDLPDLAAAPDWLMTLAFPDRPQGAPQAVPAEAPAARVPEGGRNAYLATVAGRLRRLGMDAPVILEALRAENRHKCRPPLPDDEVERIAASVSRYAAEAPVRAPECLTVGAVDFVSEFRPHTDVVERTIRGNYCYSLTAPTNAGKTAVFIDLAVSVATGMSFNGRKVKRGRVCLLCGENPYDVRPRLMAAVAERKLEMGDLAGYLYIIPAPFPLRDRLKDVMRELSDVGEFSLILGDTAAAYFHGDSEDDNVQARDHAVAIRKLTTLPGAPAVIFAAHPRKNAGRDDLEPRGGSAFLNELDGNFVCVNAGDGLIQFHWHKKLRQPGFDPLSFRLVPTALEGVFHEDGSPYETVIAKAVSEAEAVEIDRVTTEQENRILYEMLHSPRGTIRAWADAAGISKSAAGRILGTLAAEGLVKRSRRKWILTAAGKSEAQGIN